MNNAPRPCAAPAAKTSSHGHLDRRDTTGGIARPAAIASLMILMSAVTYAETSALEIMREVERRQRTQSQSNLGTI